MFGLVLFFLFFYSSVADSDNYLNLTAPIALFQFLTWQDKSKEIASSNAQGRPQPIHSGSAPSTVGENPSTKRLSAIYRRTRDLPSIMRPDKIAGENAELYFNKFSHGLLLGQCLTTLMINFFL